MTSTAVHPDAGDSAPDGRTDSNAGAALARLVAADPDLAPLSRLYFRYTPDEDIAGDDPQALLAAVREHRELAAQRVVGRSVIRIQPPEPATGTAHGPRPPLVVEIVTDDMPFLVESVLGAVSRIGAAIRRVIHPIVVVGRDLTGALTDIHTDADPDSPPPGSEVESWIRLEIEPDGTPSTAELEHELRQALSDVREVVEDTDRMTLTALRVAAELEKDPPPLPVEEVDDAARLLQWLADGNFTFLGYRRYELDTSGEQPRLTAALASGLGVLRRDSLATRTFAPGTDAMEQATARTLLVLTQASVPSRVYRPVYPYYLGVKIFDVDGRVTGEHRFLGVLTVRAMHESPLDVPVIQRRVRNAIHRAGFPLDSYSGQQMLEVISSYPRQELFCAGEDSLYETVVGVMSLAERHRLRLFLRRDPYRRFFSCLVYVPRDRYTTRSRLAMQAVLSRELHGRGIDYTARVSESPLAVVHFTVHTDPDAALEPEHDRLEAQLADALLTWDDTVLEHQGADQVGDHGRVQRYLGGLPEAYKEDFDAASALADMQRLDGLDGLDEQPDMSFYTPPDAPPGERRLKIYLLGEPVSLTRLLPLLQQMGVEVLDERPYEVLRPDGKSARIYDFGLGLDDVVLAAIAGRDPAEVQRSVTDAVGAAWRGDVEVDRFTALVLRAGLHWREVALLRAYARYLRQIGSPFSQRYLAETLLANAPAAAALVRLFSARFDPTDDPAGRVAATTEALAEVTAMIDEVTGLDADRILRGYLNLVTSTLRTNFFLDRPALAFKLDPRQVSDLPPPRPRFEIFVYSPRVEGAHLRFGPVARGGLRWSDRPEDFRTEILGLVKAQAVKNAVIVPVGAKGGFVVKRPDLGPDEVQACYRLFIAGLLDLTDNRVEGRIVTPAGVLRYDDEDSYLVVAADKGTARFSDVANEMARQYGFWLGDAFASGGSVGYDHKAMGITARGAWESVKRHFAELDLDTQSEPFTVVGIGDMSGDVFGNGMLLSPHLRLVAAFDHRHVFIDPDPDAAAGFRERQRMFALPTSSWDDYDRTLISAGGGVWARTSKAIPVGEEIRAALGLAAGPDHLTPPELIKAILQAPVDLLFNGGIGTYVKATSESHADVGDKANDAVRINGSQLRARVVVEGGNLGLTQAGRIEFAGTGGKVNTDALDNSAGVDCSDHEVNIKILLDELVKAGALTGAERDHLLGEMTDDVADLVLDDNRAQNAVLGIARAHAPDMVAVQGRLVADLEARHSVDRALEVLPDTAGFAALEAAGAGLTSPELATVLAHVKLALKHDILSADPAELEPFAARLPDYFPAVLRERFGDAIATHPLRREITTTLLVNEMVDGAGMTYAFRLGEELAAEATDAVRAYQVATAVFDLPGLWDEIDAAVATLTRAFADEIVLESRRLLDRASRWFLVNRPQPIAVAAETARFAPTVAALAPRLGELLHGRELEAFTDRAADLERRGAPAALARRVAGQLHSYGLLDVVEVAELVGRSDPGELVDRSEVARRVERSPAARRQAAEVAELYFALSEDLGIDLALRAVSALKWGDRWQALARLALRDDFYGSLRAITQDAIRQSTPDQPVLVKITSWERDNALQLSRARAAMEQFGLAEPVDLARLSVVSRQLRNLAR